jgi:hypothetical protein
MIVFTLMMEAISSCETSVLTTATRHHIPEGGILNICDVPSKTESAPKLFPRLHSCGGVRLNALGIISQYLAYCIYQPLMVDITNVEQSLLRLEEKTETLGENLTHFRSIEYKSCPGFEY